MTWQKGDVSFSQLFLWKSRQTSSSQKWGGVHGSSFTGSTPQQLKLREWRPQMGGLLAGHLRMGVHSRILDSKMFSLLLIVFGSVNASQPRCGYDSCPKPKVSVQLEVQVDSYYFLLMKCSFAGNRRGCWMYILWLTHTTTLAGWRLSTSTTMEVGRILTSERTKDNVWYLAARNDIQRAGVQYIIDSVVAALLEDEERRLSALFLWIALQCVQKQVHLRWVCFLLALVEWADRCQEGHCTRTR